MKTTTRNRLPFYLLMILFMWGCGASVGVSEDVTIIEPPPSDAQSAGRVSAFGYATGGEHYIVVHSLGDPLAETVQTGGDGRYHME